MQKTRNQLMYLRVTAPNNSYIEAVVIKSEKDIPEGVKIDHKRKIFTVDGYTGGYGSNKGRLIEYPFGTFFSGSLPHQFLGIFELGNTEHIKRVVRFADDKANRGING